MHLLPEFAVRESFDRARRTPEPYCYLIMMKEDLMRRGAGGDPWWLSREPSSLPTPDQLKVAGTGQRRPPW
jgi:hypothetical protein